MLVLYRVHLHDASRIRMDFPVIKATRALVIPAIVLLAVLSLTDICKADGDVTTPVSSQDNRLKLYISYDDDQDFFRSELNFVDFVRDRHQADVHVLVTKQHTGSGGREYTITFIGQHIFDGMQDTLRYVSLESDTDDTVRKGMLHQLELGLVRFAARTPVADKLFISFEQEQQQKIVKDKWNYWVFKTSLQTNFNGDEGYRWLNLNGRLSANRVTENWKIKLSASGSYSEQVFEDEESRDLYLSRSKSFYTFVTKSLTEHWSAGFETYVYSSLFSNQQASGRAAVGIEYNIFPYSESTNRQLRIDYLIGCKYFDYYEKTIYDKTSEFLEYQSLSVALEVVQPWGEAEAMVWTSNYLHDWGLYRIELYSDLSLNLVAGLSLDVYGGITWKRDQLSLSKEGASPEETLLRRREIASNYSYWGGFGISYSFGSIYNNIVNPRFGN
ncbi:MAG: hypothetical protein KOO62_03395 [candidate division Zixibacteria bacterium]|nr:hypothetical protein [candidate division Zixibacteria bacterium]